MPTESPPRPKEGTSPGGGGAAEATSPASLARAAIEQVGQLELEVKRKQYLKARGQTRRKRIAELMRNVGELWATFGMLDGLMAAITEKRDVPLWWWPMVLGVGSILMGGGTLWDERDATAEYELADSDSRSKEEN